MNQRSTLREDAGLPEPGKAHFAPIPELLLFYEINTDKTNVDVILETFFRRIRNEFVEE